MGTINNFGNVLLPAGSNTIDVQSLLNSAMAAAEIPLQQLQQRQGGLQTQMSTMQSIESDITALQTAVKALTNTGGGVNSFTATSSNSSLVSASADPTATAGTHSIVVNSLATTSSYYTDVVPANTPITSGSFQISVGSNPAATVTVDNTDNTLSGLAAAINGQNIGVTASVITDANGSRLALVSQTSGAAGNVTISNNTTSLNFHQAAAGVNASLTVDGVPISSTSNQVSGVIPGVTLNLGGAAPSTTVSLTVAPDTSSATSAINAFVSAWNKVVNDLNSQFDVASNGSGGGPLEADTALRGAQDQLLSAVTASVTGNNGIVNLASIGVNLNNDGTMSVDSGALANALNNNFSGVQTMLQANSGVATFLATTLNQLIDPAQGSLTLDLQGMTNTSQDLTQQINTMESQLVIQQQNLTAQYAQMETTLQEMPLLQSQITQQLAALKTS
ncbi:MAG TPA: flagellar filament capping protein FliD [Verrucomicrobiae bacterium]|nr:flagellar filament capping protein FliD [Verrucomicrobiae bacterium]